MANCLLEERCSRRISLRSLNQLHFLCGDEKFLRTRSGRSWLSIPLQPNDRFVVAVNKLPVAHVTRPVAATGGSSSGSAAIVATDIAPLALGSDTGGSVLGEFQERPTYLVAEALVMPSAIAPVRRMNRHSGSG